MARSTTPKYLLAYQVIVDRLKSGCYPIGARMPTEVELSEHFEVSRVTIRRALDMLVHDGYIESKQGSGYTVLTLSPASDTCMTSFTDALLRAGREPTSQLLSLTTLKKNSRAMSTIPSSLRVQSILRVERLRLVDGLACMLVRTFLPGKLVKNAKANDFPETGAGQSMLRILADRFSLEWSAACEDITPVLANKTLAKYLDVPVDQPLLQQSCSAYDNDGVVVFHEDVFRNGPISFNLTQQARRPLHV